MLTTRRREGSCKRGIRTAVESFAAVMPDVDFCVFRFLVFGVFAIGMALTGCDLPDRHDIEMFRKPAVWEITDPVSTGESGQERSAANEVTIGTTLPSPKSVQEDWQFWYLHHVDPDHYLGGGMMRSQRIVASNDEAIEVTLTERTLVLSHHPRETLDGDSDWRPNYFTCLNTNEQTFWHSTQGTLLRAECRVRRGPLETSSLIDVDEDRVRIEVDHLTSKEKKSLPHRGDLGGPLAVYQSLLGNPLSFRQTRESTVLLPIQETLARLQLQGRRDALVKRLSVNGLVVDSLHEAVALVSIDPSARRERYYWYDDDGVVQASNITGEKRFTYRCDEQQYAALGTAFLLHPYPIQIYLPGKKIPPGEIKQLALNVELSPDLPERTKQSVSVAGSSRPRLGAAPRQYVQDLDATSQRIITTDAPVSEKKLAGRFASYSSLPTASDTAATSIVDFNASPLRKLQKVSSSLNSLSRRELAVELSALVHSLLSLEPLSVGIRPAGVIAESSVADSTEHAILLISLLRARNIPARMVLGIRHAPNTDDGDANTPQGNRFAYHAWVIAECDEDWISLDPTTGQETAAACVALTTGDLSTLNASGFVDEYLAILRSMRLSVSAVVMK